MLERLDQCTVVGIAGLRSDGSSILHGLPDTGGKLVLVQGSAATATRKALLPALGWRTLSVLVGLACLAGAATMAIVRPLT